MSRFDASRITGFDDVEVVSRGSHLTFTDTDIENALRGRGTCYR